MTLRHLRVFIAVVDSGSMTAAAQKLFIAQPSVSQTIMELEEYYDIRLFERLSKRLYITEAGKQFLSYARHIVASFDEMEREMRQAADNSILKIGASVTVGTCILSNLYGHYFNKHPKIEIKSVIDNTMVIEEMVLKSELDFGLVEGPIHCKEIISKPFMEDELILICGNQHPFRTKGLVNLYEVAEADLILRESGSGTRELFESTVTSKGLDLNIKWVCNNSEAIKNAVISNLGVSVISKIAVASELKGRKLFNIPIRDAAFHREFSIIYHKNKFISQAIDNFWKLCLEGV